MDDPDSLTEGYFTPAADTFWEWQTPDDAVTWVGGETICFTPELRAVLEGLAPGGLPPVGAVMLLLASCRDSWPGSVEVAQRLEAAIPDLRRRPLPDGLRTVFPQLDRIAELPIESRVPLTTKVELAQAVFETCREKTSPSAARVIVQNLDSVLESERRTRLPYAVSVLANLTREIKSLREGLQQLDADSLLLRRQTGLDQLPDAADAILPACELTRQLLSELEDDVELAGLANLARRLMALTELPRRVVLDQDLSVGGVSDITNRGPLDRLLLSELAQDDDVLVARIALNQAMFLRRESPPRTTTQTRCIFLDNGIRLWGVPRVFATAVAMSLTATSGKQADVVVVGPAGTGIQTLDLQTRSGLIAALASLQSSRHSAAAFAAFCELVEEQQAEEAIFITTTDVLDDEEFAQRLAECPLPTLYVAGIERTGQFQLQVRTSRGVRPLREGWLDIHEILKPRPQGGTTLLDSGRQVELPAILHVKPLPLLLPHAREAHRMWTAGETVLAVTRDRRLMHWERSDQAARQIRDDAPVGRVLWSSPVLQDGVTTALIGEIHKSELSLISVNLETDVCEHVKITKRDERMLGVGADGSVLFLVYDKVVDVVDIESGTSVASVPVPRRLRWVRGRVFRDSDSWFVLAYNGITASFQSAFNDNRSRSLGLVDVFECAAHEGPLGLAGNGAIYESDTAAKKLWPQIQTELGRCERIGATSGNGDRIIVQVGSMSGEKRARLVDRSTGTQAFVTGNVHEVVEAAFRAVVKPRNIMARFTGILVDDTGTLTLISKRCHRWRFVFDETGNRITLVRQYQWRGASHPELPFKSTNMSSDVGFTLSMAHWDDGSLAYLDSRGLLHLKSIDKRIPELTIVLATGETSGWCANGKVWGKRYFLGDVDCVPHSEIYTEALRPFVRILP